MAKEDISVQATVFNILNKISIDLFLGFNCFTELASKTYFTFSFSFYLCPTRGFPLSIVHTLFITFDYFFIIIC